MLKSAQELGSIKSGALFAESALVLQVMEKLSSVRVWQAQVELVCRLEGEFQSIERSRLQQCSSS